MSIHDRIEDEARADRDRHDLAGEREQPTRSDLAAEEPWVVSNIDRLPKWAQEEIRLLRMRNDELAREVDRLQSALSGDGGSDFSICGGQREDDVALPSSAKYIAWSPDGGDYALRLRTGDDSLEVMCTTWQGVAVVPSASNVFAIKRAGQA